MMLMAALLPLQATTDPPRITISETDSGYRAEASEFDISQEPTVYREIEDQAASRCGSKQIKWGKFGSVAQVAKDFAKGPSKVSGFFKEFSCVVPQEAVGVSVAADWRASASDDADVRRFFETYYSRRDTGDFGAAFSMFAPESRPEASTDDSLREFNRDLGTGSRRITGVTWYVNPAGAPRLGAYAALDFVGEYTGLRLYCGYLILYRLGPSSYEIVREEQNIFQRTDEAVDPAQVAAMRAAFCREN